MDDTSKHIKLFTGSPFEVQQLQVILDANKIPFVTKNNFETGLSDTIIGGTPASVDVFIYEEDMEKGMSIVNDFTNN